MREKRRLQRRIEEIDQELCSHDGGTYNDIDWGHAYERCKKCRKIMRDLRR